MGGLFRTCVTALLGSLGMSTDDDISLGFVLGVALMSLLIFLANSESVGFSLKAEGKRVVAQCEKNLPRNQRCEVVITAKVVKDVD